jgi:hypothetical protein
VGAEGWPRGGQGVNRSVPRKGPRPVAWRVGMGQAEAEAAALAAQGRPCGAVAQPAPLRTCAIWQHLRLPQQHLGPPGAAGLRVLSHQGVAAQQVGAEV